MRSRLMAGLAILKHTYDLSDEVLCERWMENSYYLPVLRRGVLPAPPGVRSFLADALAPTHGRGEAARAAAGDPCGRHQDRSDQAVRLNPVIVDTTVQPKNVMFPTDARLLNRAQKNELAAISAIVISVTKNRLSISSVECNLARCAAGKLT